MQISNISGINSFQSTIKPNAEISLFKLFSIFSLHFIDRNTSAD